MAQEKQEKQVFTVRVRAEVKVDESNPYARLFAQANADSEEMEYKIVRDTDGTYSITLPNGDTVTGLRPQAVSPTRIEFARNGYQCVAVVLRKDGTIKITPRMRAIRKSMENA